MITKLVVDSGSTKTDWAILKGETVKIISTIGINPASDVHLPDLTEYPELSNLQEERLDIFYYGAGVIDQKTRNIIKEWLSSFFDINSVSVESDMLGAAKATAHDSPGIICILGTGSNSCVYDGKAITDNIPALGYSLSNEGGGSEIGKSILRQYFYKRMPKEVRIEFESRFTIDKSGVVHSLYKKSNPTGYLASFAQFLNITTDKVWRESILQKTINEFIEIRIKSYSEYSSYDLHFVGSISYFCRDVLEKELQINNLKSTSILRKPIDGLIEYHKTERDVKRD